MTPEAERYRDLLRAMLPELNERYGVSELGLFGSRVRGDHRPDSDLDVLVTFRPEAFVSLFTLVELEDLLAERLPVHRERAIGIGGELAAFRTVEIGEKGEAFRTVATDQDHAHRWAAISVGGGKGGRIGVAGLTRPRLLKPVREQRKWIFIGHAPP